MSTFFLMTYGSSNPAEPLKIRQKRYTSIKTVASKRRFSGCNVVLGLQ